MNDFDFLFLLIFGGGARSLLLYNFCMVNKFYYESPIGILEIEFETDTVLELRVVENKEDMAVDGVFPEEVSRQLGEYFAGERYNFDLKISLKGTEFQKKVWGELQKIPYGKTKSYQEIAEAIGHTKAQRAVGLACNRNPILLIIPCHRVISKSGKLTGFACGIDSKKILLDLETTQN